MEEGNVEQKRERKESQTEVTKSVDPEAPMRGLSVGTQGRESHKFDWTCLSRMPGSTLGLFRWPSPSALRRRILLSVQQKLLRKRNPSSGRKEILHGFYGFLASAWPKNHDLRGGLEELWA